MAENKLPFVEGGPIHRPTMFSGINYQFWKIRMKIFIELLDLSTLTTTALFGKLREHEIEMQRLNELESSEKKVKTQP